MRSSCWGSTAIFLSWDDWGGFFDHVLPPRIDENGYGLRVPGLVISPYAKAGYIDHQQLSHDAYLKFIEDDFLGGATLNPATDGRPDRRPSVREEAPGLGDLANDFDFNQQPRPPLLLSAHPSPGPASEPPGGGGPQPPTVAPGEPAGLTQTSITLNATVNPKGTAVSDCKFEFGTSVFYEVSTPCVPSPGGGTSPVAVAAEIDELTPGTTYHFRVVAANGAGTAVSGDQTFTTPVEVPTVSSVSPVAGLEEGKTGITITGRDLGAATAVDFGGVPASNVTVNSDTAITALSPAGAGVVDVTVMNSGGTSRVSSSDRFTYVPKGRRPSVTGLSPTGGAAEGGTTVSLAGSGFAGVTALSSARHPLPASRCSPAPQFSRSRRPRRRVGRT